MAGAATTDNNPVKLPVIVGTYEEVVAALAYAQWPQAQWATAVAVIQAESSRNLTVVNSLGCYGWMQVRKSAHPELFAALQNVLFWIEPTTAVTMGYKVWQQAGGSWHPWTTYTSGVYKLYLPAAQAAIDQFNQAVASLGQSVAVKQILTPLEQKVAPYLEAAGLGGDFNSVLGGIGTGAQGLGQGVGLIGTAVSALPSLTWENALAKFIGAVGNVDTWISVGYVLAGVVILGLVLFHALKASSTVQSAAAAAAKVAIL